MSVTIDVLSDDQKINELWSLIRDVRWWGRWLQADWCLPAKAVAAVTLLQNYSEAEYGCWTGMKWIVHLETDFRPSQVFLHRFRDPSPVLCGTCLFLMLDVMMLPVRRKLQWAKEQLVPIGQSLMTQCVGVILINTQTEIIKTCQGIWLLSYLLILMIIEYLCQLRRL